MAKETRRTFIFLKNTKEQILLLYRRNLFTTPMCICILWQKPEQRPGYELSMPSAIYEPTPTVELLEPGTMEQEVRLLHANQTSH